jgi:hypothetical protein
VTAEFTPASVAEMVGDWPAELDHISASMLKTFDRCPEQARRRYIKGEKIAPGAALIQGRADHSAIEHNFREKLVTGTDVSVADVQEVFAAEFDQEIESAGGVTEVDFGKKVGSGKTERRKAGAEMKDSGIRLVTAYREQECPAFQPETIEEVFEFTLPSLPVPITGRIDLVGRTHEAFTVTGSPEPPLKIIDRKTTGRTAKVPERDWRVQAGIYMLHRWLPHEWHLSVKTKEPKIVTPTTEPGLILKPSPHLKRQLEMKLMMLARQFAFMYVAFGPDNPWDGAILHSFACDYCGFRDGGPEPCAWWHRPSDLARRKP